MASRTPPHRSVRGGPLRRAASRRAALAGIGRVARAGIPGTTAAPLVFEWLHDCVRYGNGGIIWADGRGGIDGYFHAASDMRALVPTYARHFMGHREAELAVPFVEALRSEYGPTAMTRKLRVSLPAFFRHDYYGVLMQPYQVDYGLRWILRHEGRPIGMLMVGRPLGAGDFRDEELAPLRVIEADVAQALSLGGAAAARTADYRAHRGSIVADGQGRLAGAAGAAHWILAHWFDARYALRHGAPLPQPLLELAAACRARAADAPMRPATLNATNRWGRFGARAEPMIAAVPGRHRCLLHLAHWQPLDIALLEGIRALGLPPRQADVCARLASGRTEPETAVELGLSVNTVIHYRRLLYARLGIDQRQQLQAALLAAR